VKDNQTAKNTDINRKEKIRARYRNRFTDKPEIIPADEQSNIFDSDKLPRVAMRLAPRISTGDTQQTASFELQRKYYEDLLMGKSVAEATEEG